MTKPGSDVTKSLFDLQLALELEGARTLLDDAGNKQQQAFDRAVKAEERIRVRSQTERSASAEQVK